MITSGCTWSSYGRQRAIGGGGDAVAVRLLVLGQGARLLALRFGVAVLIDPSREAYLL